MSSSLRADTHVTEMIPIVPPKPLPFGIPETWSHMATTLIHGTKEAVLIDPPLTIDQGHELVTWIKTVLGPKKTLTTIYITHGHGDHYFTIPILLDEFPGSKVYATEKSMKHMEEQIVPPVYTQWWEGGFPGQILKPPMNLIQKLDDGYKFNLEGHDINIIEAGHSDTDDSTFVHIPDLNMVVAGDICYNELHQWLVESTEESARESWIAALEKIAALKPATVIASHKRPGAVDGINNVYSTIGYIRTFGELKKQSKSPEELYHKMIEKYPQRINPIILWLGCLANFGEFSF